MYLAISKAFDVCQEILVNKMVTCDLDGTSKLVEQTTPDHHGGSFRVLQGST